GHVHEAGDVQVLLLDPRSRHERDDRRHAVTPALLRGSRAFVPAALVAVFFATAGRAQAQVRQYWIAALPAAWHAVPDEPRAGNGVSADPQKTTLEPVVYRRYTKGFGKMIPNGPDNPGITGPLIQAEVGDRILVHFQNLDTLFNRPHSMHFHGVRYRPGSDG